MLENKAPRYNSAIIKADRFYPSSKLCNKCNYKNGKITINEKRWTCPSCKATHNRDLNAAINLKNNALYTVGSTGINACGDINLCDVFETKQVKSMKQEVKDVSLNKSVKTENGNDL